VAVLAAVLRRFHRAPGWSCDSMRGGQQCGVARITRSSGRGGAHRRKGKRRCFGQNPMKWQRANDLGQTIGEKGA
jgi:hypothetical protein